MQHSWPRWTNSGLGCLSLLLLHVGYFRLVSPSVEAGLDGKDFLFPNEVVEFQLRHLSGGVRARQKYQSKDILYWRARKYLL